MGAIHVDPSVREYNTPRVHSFSLRLRNRRSGSLAGRASFAITFRSSFEIPEVEPELAARCRVVKRRTEPLNRPRAFWLT
jgi:hypothetical protein